MTILAALVILAPFAAAWIRALIGVGAAMASGNQLCSGNCADFATTPRASSNVPASSSPLDIRGTAASTSDTRKELAAEPSTKMPKRNPTSPTRVMRNALIAAAVAPGSSQWCPIRKYEHTPMISQPT